MITFSQIGNLGRLGNQLFQYAFLKSVEIKTKRPIVFSSDFSEKSWHGQKCLLKNFKLPSIKYGNFIHEQTYVEKSWTEFDDNVYKIDKNTDFYGFYQNIKYFFEYRDIINKEFEMNSDIELKISKFLSNYTNTKVSLHIRRGDCSDGTNPELAQIANDFSNNSLQFKYYSQALKIIPKDSTIFLFTGGSRNTSDYSKDLEWCKEKFSDKRIVFIDNFNDIESFCCMKNCDINILSFASTFSLWGGYLNKTNKCIAPSYFHPNINFNPNDLFYPEWKVI